MREALAAGRLLVTEASLHLQGWVCPEFKEPCGFIAGWRVRNGELKNVFKSTEEPKKLN